MDCELKFHKCEKTRPSPKFYFRTLQACPEEVISIDSIRAAMGVGLVPNNQRQKLEEKGAADEKTAPEPVGENSLVFLLFNTSDGECFVRLFIVSRISF